MSSQREFMRLDQCKVDIDLVVSAPVERIEPEPEWVAVRDSGVLPPAVFALYSRSSFLSFGAAPPFLSDDKRFLFSYFSMVMNSLRQSLSDADNDLRLFVEAQSKVYDPGKKLRSEEWEPDADDQARSHFRSLLLSLQSALDASADLIALFLTPLIPGLRVGRAQFSRIEAWLERPLPQPGLVVTPQRHYLERLYDEVRPIVRADTPERDWLPLMRMLRNKAAHLGDNVFRYVGLHDAAGTFYTFIPRRWPYIWEEHMHPAGQAQSNQQSVGDLFRATLVHDGIVAYARGLRVKVTVLVAAVASVVDGTYVAFKDFGANVTALAELEGSSQAFEFEHWV